MFDKKLIFVTGKGGTGKSTIALYLARKLSLMGKKVLLVELGERSSSQSLAQMNIQVQYQPQNTALGFDASLLNGVNCLKDYVGSFIKVEKLTQYFFDNPVMKALLDIAPGLDDLAILGKLTSDIRHHGPSFHYDHIVIDSHSTGSYVSMLQAPLWLSQMVSSGPLHTQSYQISETLEKPGIAHTLFVGLLEDSPVDELLGSTEEFKKISSMDFSVIINKKLPNFEVTGSEPWRGFIGKKISQQERLLKVVKEKYKQLYYKNFVTQKLKEDILSFKNGEDLFPLIN